MIKTGSSYLGTLVETILVLEIKLDLTGETKRALLDGIIYSVKGSLVILLFTLAITIIRLNLAMIRKTNLTGMRVFRILVSNQNFHFF